MKLSRLIPQTLGGDGDNIWNTIIGRSTFINRCISIPQARKPLWDFIRHHHCKTILEIGLGSGDNARKMLDLAGDDCEYYCFDNLSQLESQIAFRKLKGRKNVHFYIGDTRETLPKFIDKLPMMDLIFIDGDHSYEGVKDDFSKYAKFVKPGGIVAFHDIVSGPPENVGGVPKFWGKVRQDFRHVEIVEDWNQGGCGIGVIYVE